MCHPLSCLNPLCHNQKEMTTVTEECHVSEAYHVCHRWHTQCESFPWWAWKLWLWRTQPGASMTATMWETSCLSETTSTCQVLQGRTHCVATTMKGTASKPFKSNTVASSLLSYVLMWHSSGLEFDSPACQTRTIVTWGLWPKRQQRSRAVPASCGKGFTACWLDRHMRPLQRAEFCRSLGQTLWVSLAPSCISHLINYSDTDMGEPSPSVLHIFNRRHLYEL